MKKSVFAIVTLALVAAVCTPVVLAKPQSTCSSSKAKATCSSTQSASLVKAEQSSCSSSCPTSTAMQSLVKALYLMDQADGQNGAKSEVRVALAALAESNPKIASSMSEKCSVSASMISLASNPAATCSSSKTTCSSTQKASLVNAEQATCSSTKAAVAKASGTCSSAKAATLTASTGGTCGTAPAAALASNKASGCCKSQQGKNAALASNADCANSCKTKGANASYVAYGCDKSNSIARAAAEGYLRVLVAMKQSSGADDCPMETAQKTLASTIDQMMTRQRMTQAEGTTQTVSMSAMSDCPPACKAVCEKLGMNCQTAKK